MMSQRRPISKIQKELSKFVEEKDLNKVLLEKDKLKFSEELMKFKKDQIQNTIHKEENYTLWRRILKTLGMS
jgi:hypothetical protein